MLEPKDLDLPKKFTHWRPRQLETAAKIATSQKYAFLLDSPTGTGKSVIAAAVQRIANKKITYLCTTKQLQDQLLRDFPYARTLKGRSNYKCLLYPKMYPQITAEMCTHSDRRPCPHRKDGKCPYTAAKRAALSAPLAVLNASYFLHEANYVGGFSDQEFLVVDEFDTMEDQLMSFLGLTITQRQLKRLDIPPPRYKTKFDSWVTWAEKTHLAARNDLATLARELESPWAELDVKLMRRKIELDRLVSRLAFFIREVDKSWVWYPEEERWTFRPVWVSRYASTALWKHTKKVLGMSATILDPRQVSTNVGLTSGDRRFDYISLPSPFPKENRPVYYEPCANVVEKELSVALPRLAKAVKRILENHPDDRILIHTVSYKVRNYLKDNVDSDRIITHSTKDRASVLDFFKSTKSPKVLLSPSMERGVDLPYEQCRVVVVAKCAFPDLGDPQIRKRLHGSRDGNNWYAHRTISTIVQMAGRAVRSDDDYAKTYVLDAQFERLYNEHRDMFPGWFKEAVIM